MHSVTLNTNNSMNLNNPPTPAVTYFALHTPGPHRRSITITREPRQPSPLRRPPRTISVRNLFPPPRAADAPRPARRREPNPPRQRAGPEAAGQRPSPLAAFPRFRGRSGQEVLVCGVMMFSSGSTYFGTVN